MSQYTDAWNVITPFGPVVVDFPEEGPAIFEGSGLAVDHLMQVMGERTNRMGQTMTAANLEPHDLLFFCQGEGVKVLPPVDFIQYEPEENMNAVTLDDAGGASLASLRQTLKTTQGVLAKIAIMGQIVDLMTSAKPLAGKALIDGNEIDIYAENFGLAPWPKTLPDDSPLLVPTDSKEFAEMADGTTVPRAKLHDDVVGRFFEGVAKPSGRKPVAYVMGGGGASGKGTIKKILIKEGVIPAHGPVELDPDEIKASIPEYQKIIDAGDSRAAGVVHEESSTIAKRILSAVIDGGYDLTYDVTLGDETKGIAILKRLQDAGYEVNLIGVVIDPAVALFRADKRARRSGRYVPTKDLLKAHKGFLAAFERYAAIADSAVLYDNSSEKEEKLVSVTQADGTQVLSTDSLESAKQRNQAINENASNLSEASPRSQAVANAVHQGTASPGDQGPTGSGSPDQGEGQTVPEGQGLSVTQPEDLAQTSAADDAVANGERPRLETKQFYEFDPNRKHSQRKRDNAAAMALLDQIDAGDVDPKALTADQKQALAKYSGTGGALIGADGKKGSAYEYYTPSPIAEGMWELLKELGATGGRCLDPCAATGVFGATAPANFAIDAIELNETSGRINGLVNNGPGYRAVVSAFEAVAAATEDETFDVVASNVPFGSLKDRGEQRFKDTKYQDEPIQNYFILRGLEKLRPGGLAIFITPPRCVSGRGGKEEDLRYRASLMAEFMGAYRLPNKVFGTADADTMTDVIVFRKFSRDVRDKVNELREQNPRALIDANVLWQEFIGGTYFQGEGKPFILGTMAKVKGRFGETDALHSDLSMAEIAKLMRKFGPSRIDWDSLDAVETEPITYSEGDTIQHAGQTLQMKGGRLVALDSVSSKGDRAELAATMANLDTPLDAVQNKVTLAQASEAYQRMIDTARELDIPSWLRDSIRSLRLLGESKQNTYWNAGVTGLAVLQVMTHHQGEETGFDFLTGYADLSDKVQRVAFDAKKPPTALGGRLRDGMARIGVIYTKKTGFSAVWRGDVVTDQADGRTESERVEAVKYKNGSLFVTIEDIKGIYGQDFDPIASPDWCVSADGQTVAKASDYYAGNYGDFLRRIDGEIKAAKDPVIKDKLLRQKADADKMVDRVDPSKMTFNLFSPFVTMEEKADFLRRFVDPRFAIGYDEEGKAVIDITIKDKDLNERAKLLKRMAIYLKNGTHTLGGIAVADEAAALANLRKMTETAASQFNAWTKANPAIMARLSATANDPERLYFTQVDDETPMEIPGLNPDFRMNGYKFADIRKVARNFSGINGYGVGLGKTSFALAAVQHIQNIGVKNKTLFVVPNSVLSNWRKEASMVLTDTSDCLYVGLEITKEGDAKVKSKNYDTDLMRILENRHKKIFVTMEAFARLRLRQETAEAYDSYLASVDQSYAESDDKKKDVKAEGKRAKLIHGLVNSKSKSAAAPFFEDLGIDSIVIDEAHAYKNSSEANDFEGGRYLSLAKSSDRGDDAQAKTWFVRKQSGERGDGVLCLTATAITNSPLEIYSMLSLSTGHKRLNDMMMGIKGADQFMETMCVMEGKQETAIDGTEKDYNVFTGLTNVSVLRGAISQVCVIKNAKDVGAMIKLPEADETPVSVALPDDIVSDLIDYQQAFRFAIDTLKEKDKVGGDAAAFDRVAAKFGEPMELIGHPFNLINKMAALILDKELDDRGTFYTFDDAARAKAEKVVADYNAKAPVEDRTREGPQTRPDAVVGTKTKKDGDKKVTILQIKALARIEGNRIIIDTINPETQTKFEDLADKAGLDLDVTVPPKLAALIDNFQKEEANPRGIGDGGPTGRVKQIIFCDALPLHNKIKRLLTKRCGVASGSIAIITGKINGKPEEIMEVQDGFNADGEDNKYRVVIANEKAEVGINLQKGTQAIHHLTIGWTPDSLTQRNGRGVRQGNKTDRVTVYQYDADGTFDSYKRKLVSKKADWIDNVMSKDGGDHVTVEGGLSDEAQEALIDSIGNANGMSMIQARVEADERKIRAATNKAKQVINLQTAMAQTTFLEKYAKPTAWAADKMVAYVAVLDQISAIKDRLRNPKLQANTIIRMEALQADLTARSNGMRAELVESVEARKSEGSYGNFKPVGDPVTLEAMIQNAIGGYSRKGVTNESKIRDWFETDYGMIKTVKVGSPIENEWQSEVDMAKAMVEESKKDFVAMAERQGAYSAEILTRIDSGEATLIDGKIICKGAFVRDKKGSLTLIYKTNGRFYARNGINFASVNAVDVMRGGEVVLPGAAGYDECLDEAAKLDDAYLAKLTSVKPDSKNNLLGSILPEVAQRWKGVFDVTYEVRRYLLPHPHFPIVITPAQAELGDVLAAIHLSQKGIVKSTTEGYFPEFTVAGDVAVTSDRNTISETAFIDYARAHSLKISRSELSTMGITKVADLMEEGVIDTFQTEVIDGALNEDALIANLDAWLKKALSIFKLETAPKYLLSPVDFLDDMLTQRSIFNARRASLNAGKTPEQAEQVAEVDPNRMVGINGDTKNWKDQIKMCAQMAGGRAIWDGNAGCWNVTFKGWQKLIAMYPDAEKALSVVESSGKTSYGRRRR